MNSKVTIIGECHCTESCHEGEAKLISAICPDSVLLEMLPASREIDRCCELLTQRDITVSEFFKQTGFADYWGPSAPYRPLFAVLTKGSVPFGPLDHSSKDRQRLSRMERDLILAYKEGRSIDALLRKERLLLFQLRDLAFVRNVIKALSLGAANIVAVMGSNHVENVARYVQLLGYMEVEAFDLGPVHSSLAKKEISFSERQKRELLSADVPPLVLINELLYEEVFVDIRRKRQERSS